MNFITIKKVPKDNIKKGDQKLVCEKTYDGMNIFFMLKIRGYLLD